MLTSLRRSPDLVVCGLVTVLLVLSAFVRPMDDLERYWLLWLGHVVATSGPPHVMSAAWGSLPYVGHEWLAGLFVDQLVAHHLGVLFAVLTALAAAAPLWICAEVLRDRQPPIVAAIILAFSGTMLLGKFELRAEPYGLAMLAITLFALHRGGRWLLLLPPLFGLWGNVHGSFLFGLVVFAPYVIARRSVALAGLGVLCAVATLANPYGVGLWAHILTMSTEHEFHQAIREWQPTWQLMPWVVIFLAAPLVLARRTGWSDKAALPLAVIGLVLGMSTLRIGYVASEVLLPFAFAGLGPMTAIPRPPVVTAFVQTAMVRLATVTVVAVLVAPVLIKYGQILPNSQTRP